MCFGAEPGLRLCKNQKSGQFQIDSCILRGEQLVCANSFASSHLIDLAVMQNCYLSLAGESDSASRCHFGLVSDLHSLVFTQFDGVQRLFRVSKVYPFYCPKKKEFGSETIAEVLETLKALLSCTIEKR